jgi:hypothetical protein
LPESATCFRASTRLLPKIEPDVLWKLARYDLPILCLVCREELITALACEEDD